MKEKPPGGGARHIETKDPPHTEMKSTGSECLAGFGLSVMTVLKELKKIHEIQDLLMTVVKWQKQII